VPEVTVGEHFERVAAVYESLRTTDEAPVRQICQLLPDRPVTGLDIGCGTGRYTRLLRALLPEGSLLVASDVSAAMLAQLKAANRDHAGGVVPCWQPPNSCRCGPPASTWSPRSTAFTTSTSAAS
jgi:ubiquinone/menaquinone biosynthesis C-methylase UbiE